MLQLKLAQILTTSNESLDQEGPSITNTFGNTFELDLHIPMLSNQFPELRSTHKRQNSSPNISLVAPIAQQFQEAYNRPTNQHRRGLSLDRTMHKQEPTNQLSSTNGTVSIDPRLYGQQQMREPHGLPGPGPGTDFAIMDSRKMALDARYSPFGPDSAFVNSVPMEVIQESTHFGEGDGGK